MRIERVSITNFRGLTVDIDRLKKSFLIIGKNDSGKSNFCYALRKVLDYNIRRQPMVQADSTDSNLEDISIILSLNLKGISSNNRANLRDLIDSHEDGSETLTVELIATFNEDTQMYDENIIFGTLDQSNPKSATNGNELDKVLDFIYVYPNYDLSRDTTNYFAYHKQKNNKDGVAIGKEIIDGIKDLNTKISTDNVVQTMKNEINDLELMKEMFGDVSFGIQSDFDLSNVYKSLKINPILTDGRVLNIGDGKSKTLALLLQKLIKNNEKEKIIVLEEPENHLFPLLQKQYASIIEKFGFGQTIVTTHSPSIIDFRKTEEIFKFNFENNNGNREFRYYRVNIDTNEIYKDFGYSLNEEIAESFFYNEVLLIEGFSEKIFYNRLINTDTNFREKVLGRGIGFICVYGVDFIPAKSILEALGIKVHVLTDNDFFTIANTNSKKKRYAGLQNALKLLNKEQCKKLNEIFENEITNDIFNVEIGSKEHKYVESIMEPILEFFSIYGIYIHLDHDSGFEGAFVDFLEVPSEIKNETIEMLKEKKMKNLHAYLVDNNIKLLVTDSNKGNILVRFIYES
jgi:putative ATP-dependent endonuclease of OLD family